ncbi:Hypothetical protein Cp106_0628 [Corynebacterium pseudotuberculosis 1/06-A]|nr:Hypothetical protein Cp106_0628 [Corynebacterium pseudotuberculosis 1/06-A]
MSFSLAQPPEHRPGLYAEFHAIPDPRARLLCYL